MLGPHKTTRKFFYILVFTHFEGYVFYEGNIHERKLQTLLNSIGTSEFEHYLANRIDGDNLCE